MKRLTVYLIVFTLILLLAACKSETPAATPSSTVVPATSTPAISTPVVSTAPPPAATTLPTATPLAPAQQALLEERDMAAHEMFATLEQAKAQDFPEEQTGKIIRTYVATIEAIEARLDEENVPFAPLALPPTPPVKAEKKIFDIGMVTEDGVHLKGTYYQPAAVNAPGVALLHMLGRKRGDWDAFARQLQDAGYGVITIDLRGHGESGGRRDWAKMPLDAAIATKFIRSREEIDPDRIVLMGASIGANIAINAAAKDPDIAGVALLSPGLDYRGVKTEEAVKQYGARPLFIAASSEDDYAAQSARKLDSLAQGPHQLLILDNQGHGTQMLGKDNGLEKAILQWLAEVTAK